MNPIESLTAGARSWHGTNTLQDPFTSQPEESPSTATITPVLGDKFARLDYTWSYQGKPQEGSMLIGFDPKTSEVTLHWIDSWHMSRAVLACKGTATDGKISIKGSYPAPPGPDWGWRIDITPAPLRITHTNIDAEGTEDLAAEGVYAEA